MTEVESDLTDDLDLDELFPRLEFGCWTAIALFPFLYWINGPSVSTNQYVIRNILLCIALISASACGFGIGGRSDEIKVTALAEIKQAWQAGLMTSQNLQNNGRSCR